MLTPSCIEYGTHAATRDSDDERPVDTDTGPADVCDGLDDDLDGRIDEDAPDLDGNAIADCVECRVVGMGAEPVWGEPACVAPTPSSSPWEVELLWMHEPSGFEPGGCRVTTVGDVDCDGNADVVCVGQPYTSILDGMTGDEIRRIDEIVSGSATALIGACPDRLLGAFDDLGRVVAFSADGSVRWTGAHASPVIPGLSAAGINRTSMAIADVDGDGAVDIVASDAAVRLIDGEQISRHVVADDARLIHVETIGADLDLDGIAEISGKGTTWASTGASWSAAPHPSQYWTPAPVPVQWDDDPAGELVWLESGGDQGLVYDADGTVSAALPFPGEGHPLMGCAGDLDGDGGMELVVPFKTSIRAWSPGGGELWAQPFSDGSSYVGCTTFDFDLDGAKEVLAAGDTSLAMLDGRTGTVRFESMRESGTVKDVPIVADLDGDGSVEIVISGPDDRLWVYRHASGEWPPGLPMWPYESWSGVGMWPDGTPRFDQDPPWLEYGIWRGQPEWVAAGNDVHPEVVEACVAEADLPDAEVRLSVRIVNLGPQDALPGLTMAVYRLKPDGSRALLQTLTHADALAAGTASATWEVVSTREQAEYGFVLVAGDDGSGQIAVDDCDESDNELIWTMP